MTSAGCGAAVTTGSRLPLSSALSSSLAPQQATREHTSSGLWPAAITRDNTLLSLIYGEKIWAGPPGPVSPCHPQSVNTVLGSEEQNLFCPPGRHRVNAFIGICHLNVTIKPTFTFQKLNKLVRFQHEYTKKGEWSIKCLIYPTIRCRQ